MTLESNKILHLIGQHWLDVKRYNPTFIATVMPDVELKTENGKRKTEKPKAPLRAPILGINSAKQTGLLRRKEVKKAELERVTLKISISDTVMEQAFRLMRAYSLLPTDAFHIAIALDAGIRSFASLDADFFRVNDIVVYACVP